MLPKPCRLEAASSLCRGHSSTLDMQEACCSLVSYMGWGHMDGSGGPAAKQTSLPRKQKCTPHEHQLAKNFTQVYPT